MFSNKNLKKMKKLILLLLAVITIGCTPEEIKETETMKNGTLNFRFKNKDYVVNNNDKLGSYIVNQTRSTTDYNLVSFYLPLEKLADNKNRRIQGTVFKANGTTNIIINEVVDGFHTNYYIVNPKINITYKDKEITNLIFSGDGLENGLGKNLKNENIN